MQASDSAMRAIPFLLLICGFAILRPGCVTDCTINDRHSRITDINNFSEKLLRAETLLADQRRDVHNIQPRVNQQSAEIDELRTRLLHYYQNP
jgi:hypothetical protein